MSEMFIGQDYIGKLTRNLISCSPWLVSKIKHKRINDEWLEKNSGNNGKSYGCIYIQFLKSLMSAPWTSELRYDRWRPISLSSHATLWLLLDITWSLTIFWPISSFFSSTFTFTSPLVCQLKVLRSGYFSDTLLGLS